jgi:2-keto-4-pentenoate hydratase
MSPTVPIEHITHALVQARRHGDPWLPPGGFDAALGMSDAYRIQDAVAKALGWFPSGRPAAWKAGGKPAMSAAPMPRVVASGAPWDHAVGHDLVAEAEIAVRLGRTPTHAADAADCVATLCVSLEIVGTRLAGGLSAPAAWKLADQGVHGLLVVGAERDWTPRDWAAQSCSLQINDQPVLRATGTHPNGDVLAPLTWLCTHARERGLPLQAGDLVTTGAWLVAPIRWGDRITVAFDNLGTASLG